MNGVTLRPAVLASQHVHAGQPLTYGAPFYLSRKGTTDTMPALSAVARVLEVPELLGCILDHLPDIGSLVRARGINRAFEAEAILRLFRDVSVRDERVRLWEREGRVEVDDRYRAPAITGDLFMQRRQTSPHISHHVQRLSVSGLDAQVTADLLQQRTNLHTLRISHWMDSDYLRECRPRMHAAGIRTLILDIRRMNIEMYDLERLRLLLGNSLQELRIGIDAGDRPRLLPALLVAGRAAARLDVDQTGRNLHPSFTIIDKTLEDGLRNPRALRHLTIRAASVGYLSLTPSTPPPGETLPRAPLPSSLHALSLLNCSLVTFRRILGDLADPAYLPELREVPLITMNCSKRPFVFERWVNARSLSVSQLGPEERASLHELVQQAVAGLRSRNSCVVRQEAVDALYATIP